MVTVIKKPSWPERIWPWFRGFDLWLLLASLLLAATGLLTMYSSGFEHPGRFAEHGRNMLMALALMFFVAQIPPRRLQQLAVPLYLIGLSLLLAVAWFGISKKGAQRWIDVGVVVQPSELLKIATPLLLAWWFQWREDGRKALDFALAFVLLAIPVGLIVRQPDLGTAILVLIVGLSVIFYAGLSWKLILPPLLLVVVAITLVLFFDDGLCAEGVDWRILKEYQRQRICTLLDPSRDPLGRGFHTLQSMIAIGSGGIQGKGFMQGTQTHLQFIPERTTDFIFAVFAEEFGLVGSLLLIAGFVFLIFRGLIIAAEAPTLFSRLLAASISTIFFAYAFVNMAMVSGILPVVGVPLPFLSYGGTSILTLGLALGILMSVARSRRMFVGEHEFL